MATDTMSMQKSGADTLEQEPFLYESSETTVVTDSNRWDLPIEVSGDQAVTRVVIATEDGHDFQLICSQADKTAKMLMRDDRATGFTYFALRRGQVIRNGHLVDNEFLTGLGISTDFHNMILLDQEGRRFGKPIQIKEAAVDRLHTSE